MGSLLQFGLLFVCWLGALATLLVFLESWFGLSGRARFAARRASGAYGVISVFVPMHGSSAKVERAVRSIFNQSYPFIEIFLIHSEEQPHFAGLAKQFQSARSHIPVRVVTTSFPLDSQHDRTRALEQAQPAARGRWLIILDALVNLDRFGIEMALEFAGSNEISALGLRPGLQCRSLLQRLIAPSMEQLLQMVRIANRRRSKRDAGDVESPFLLVNREAFETVNRNNRMPGILNEQAWNVWGYQLEGFRTFEGDGSRWMWRDADVRSWSSDTDPERRYSNRSASFVIGSVLMALVSVAGLAFGFTHRLDNFVGTSILAFSAVSYSLMAVSYFLFARRLRAAGWFAPFWFLGYLPAAVLTLMEIRRGRHAAMQSSLYAKSQKTVG
ncbi:MAG TPA: glycosyltransferase [Terriglobia bacterium]|nr:glycosyltransferase [Terriglobia bacterium]